MSDERRRILNMMAEGKLSTSEAEALLDALSAKQAVKDVPPRGVATSQISQAKYLRVLVEGPSDSSQVNVRVPVELIRAGMRLAALLPVVAYEPVQRALKQHGLDVDISKFKSEDLDGLVTHLQELRLDVTDGPERVQVFCE